MQVKRVVITGAGVVSPFGLGVEVLFSSLLAGKSGVTVNRRMEGIRGATTKVAATVPDFNGTCIARSVRRSMSRASQFAWVATQEALQSACLTVLPEDDSVGLAAGSTAASVENMETFFRAYLPEHSIEQITAMLFFRTMGHSVAANLTQALGITGRVLAPSAACSTSLQAIGLGYEAIRNGTQRVMLCGGADEYHPLTSGTFDIMAAASTRYNDMPNATPRPFDRDRDGIVCAEGAGMLVLEEMESALLRGAPVLGEIVGFASTSDSSNMATPSAKSIRRCMQKVLEQSGLTPENIDYINAHATGTLQGDAAEAEAIGSLFPLAAIPVSSLKGHLGHTMAASGSIELAACLSMMRQNVVLPTKNLDNPDQTCKKLRLIQNIQKQVLRYIIKNSFALGGINCSLIIKNFDKELL